MDVLIKRKECTSNDKEKEKRKKKEEK